MKSWRHRARRLLRRVLPPRTGAVILGYHRIADPETAVGGDLRAMCVSPAAFREQMRTLREVGHPVALSVLLRALNAGRPVRGMIVVTFDDAYEDVLTIALPELERLQIPATVFFVAGQAARPFWWDRLAPLLAEADTSLPFRIEAGGSQFAWMGVGSFQELWVRLHRVIRVLDDSERERVLERLADVWRVAPSVDLPHPLDDEQARTLLQSGCIEAGAHSVSHPPLAEVPPRRAEEEIVRSREMLRDALGREIDAFSYPHGSGNDLTDRLVKRAGFTSACQSFEDSVQPSSDPFGLPRVWVRDHSGRAFRRQVARYVGRTAAPSSGARA